jgi:FkbM family methyltransferase
MTNNFASGEFEITMQISYDPSKSEKANFIGINPGKSIFRDVKVLPLDHCVREKNPQRLDFINCDVEGFEIKALKGLLNTQKDFRSQLSI